MYGGGGALALPRKFTAPILSLLTQNTLKIQEHVPYTILDMIYQLIVKYIDFNEPNATYCFLVYNKQIMSRSEQFILHIGRLVLKKTVFLRGQVR